MALCPGLPRWAGTRKVKPIWIFAETTDSEWQWHQLGHMQVCTSLQTDNHASTPPLGFFTGRMPFLPPNQQRQSTECTQSTEGTTCILRSGVKLTKGCIAPGCPQNCPLSLGDLGPPPNTRFLVPTRIHTPKQHLDQFGHCSTSHGSIQHTDTHRDHQ